MLLQKFYKTYGPCHLVLPCRVEEGGSSCGGGLLQDYYWSIMLKANAFNMNIVRLSKEAKCSDRATCCNQGRRYQRNFHFIKRQVETQETDMWHGGKCPAGNYRLKVKNRNAITRYEICSKLTIKTLE